MSETISAEKLTLTKICSRYRNTTAEKSRNREGAELLDNMLKLLHLVIGTLIVWPAAWIVPKKTNLLLFIGNGDGQFRDNVKYLFLHFFRSSPAGIELYFLTENRQVQRELQRHQLPVLFFPRLITFWKMLRACVVVADNFAWIKRAKYHFLVRAFKIQLWHGCSIKRLELDDPLLKPSPASALGRILYAAAGRFPTYDLFLSTSEANTKNIFQHAFRYRRVIETGYPRNDVFFRKPDAFDLMGTDTAVLEKSEALKDQGHKIVLYAPTYRDTGKGDDFLQQNALDIPELDRFGKAHRIVFVFKVHPNRRFDFDFQNRSQLLLYHSTADVYPFLPLVDLLLTDYSSIFFDYLLLDRPIVFFPYDYEKYIQKDRKLKYDYNWVTPGPKCTTQPEVQQAILRCLSDNENDTYQKKRKEILEMSFSYTEGEASGDIMHAINSAFVRLFL
jgi:CDP-glycerol glycerophosphotransferase